MENSWRTCFKGHGQGDKSAIDRDLSGVVGNKDIRLIGYIFSPKNTNLKILFIEGINAVYCPMNGLNIESPRVAIVPIPVLSGP